MLYRPDLAWEGNNGVCNGIVTSFAGNTPECAPTGGGTNLKLLARKLGTINGAASPDGNHAVGEHMNADTSPDPPNGDIELNIAEPVQLPDAPEHFLVGGVDVAVLDCAAGPPLFSFVLNDATGFAGRRAPALARAAGRLRPNGRCRRRHARRHCLLGHVRPRQLHGHDA